MEYHETNTEKKAVYKNLIGSPRLVIEKNDVGTINTETGEIKSEEKIANVYEERTYIVGDVDNFVKVFYSEFRKMREMGFNVDGVNIGVMQYICENMTYANPENDFGGQIVYITSEARRAWADSMHISERAVYRAVEGLAIGGHIIKLGRGIYMANPYLYGKGSSKDISMLRARVEIKARTDKGKSPSLTYRG